MKRRILALIGAAVVLSSTGCGLANGTAGGQTYSYYPTEEELAAAAAEMSTDLKEGTIWIEGVTYELPLKAQSFYDNGWAFSTKVTEKYDPFPARTQLDGDVDLEKTDGENTFIIGTSVRNPEEADVAIEDVYITSVSFSRYDKVTVIFPHGISWGSTMEEIEAAYGEPTSKGEVGSDATFYNATLSYDFENAEGGIRFTFTKDPGEEYKMSGMTYRAYIEFAN